MLPPPARFSPGRDLNADNHKRGRSFESGMHFRDKDDDLALFNDVQNKESDNFLLQSNDDLDDLFATRLRYFSDCKLAVSVPARGESSDFLNAEGDKNDYDWLITPPDTPLFPCLDDETPHVNLPSRGRPRSQPRSISRSSTMEKSYQSSRGSASPSSRPSSSTYQSRGRLSSSPSRRSSPSPNKHGASMSPPTFRNTTPSRRPSPPHNNPSISVTPRRRSTDSTSSSRIRGASPVKTSRGNSMSPKIKAWQSNIPGFSSEVPPNLLTSLTDRPTSNMRGSSPAPRNSLKSGRQSTSPSGSRSISSSQSHDRDQFSSRGRGDDDIDSVLSISMSSSSAPKSNNKALGYSKRPSRTISQNSAPKRSSDIALRQMDQQKAPHNMFRPLLSSVPTSTFYSGNVCAAHAAVVSRNSSITTSSHASTDLGTSCPHDTEDSEQNPEEVSSMFTASVTPLSTIQGPSFAYDDGGDKMHVVSSSDQYGEVEGHGAINFESIDNEYSDQHGTSAEGLVGEVDSVVCSKCSCSFDAVNLTKGDLKLCPRCSELIPVTPTPLMTKTGISATLLECECPNTSTPSFPFSGSTKSRDNEQAYHNDQHFQSEANTNVFSEDDLAQELNEKRLGIHPEISGRDISFQQALGIQGNSNSKVGVPEAAGISLLFKRSSSCAEHIVQNMSFASSDFPSEDLAYVRDTAYSFSSSVGQGSMSTSSSTDMSSVKHVETRIQRQHNGKSSEAENYRYDTRTKHQRSVSYLSGASTHNLQFLNSTINSCEEGSELSVVHVEMNTVEEKHSRPQESTEVSAVYLDEHIMEEACTESHEQSVTEDDTEGGFTGLPDSGCGTARECSSNSTIAQLESTSVAPVSNLEEFTSPIDSENSALLTNKEDADTEVLFTHCETNTAVHSSMSSSCVDNVDGVQVQDESSLDTPSGAKDGVLDSSNPESVISSPNPRSKEDEMQESPIPLAPDNVASSSGIHEESTVLLEGQGRTKARSLTLDEAMDTILFCSSIVQNLAYEAVNTAIEKENSMILETSRPTVTIVGKANTNTDRSVPRNRTASRRTPKLQKAQKPVERDQKPPPSNTENEENMEDVSTTKMVGAPNKVDSLKPPKLESKCNCTIM